jgi:hypothetical protein
MNEKEFNLKKIANLLVSAFEGGSNYWYRIDEFEKPQKIDFRLNDQQIFKHIDYPLNEGGALLIKDTIGDKNHTLDLEKIKMGFDALKELTPSYHYEDYCNNTDDAITGDVFLQLCLFSKIRYS